MHKLIVWTLSVLFVLTLAAPAMAQTTGSATIQPGQTIVSPDGKLTIVGQRGPAGPRGPQGLPGIGVAGATGPRGPMGTPAPAWPLWLAVVLATLALGVGGTSAYFTHALVNRLPFPAPAPAPIIVPPAAITINAHGGVGLGGDSLAEGGDALSEGGSVEQVPAQAFAGMP